MRIPAFLLFAIFASSCFVGLDSQANAQELKKTMRDYRHDPIFNYQPDDPFSRSQIFKIHTGHYGKFYNCDGEEHKRYSPYICWKTHHENNFPSKMGFRERICHDIAEVKQRLSDGACGCQIGCKCKKCRIAAPAGPSCSCVECSMAAARETTTSSQFASNPNSKTNAKARQLAPIISENRMSGNSIAGQPVTATNSQVVHNPKFGLVSGKILNVRVDDKPASLMTRSQRLPIVTQRPNQPVRVADKGVADFWSQLKFK